VVFYGAQDEVGKIPCMELKGNRISLVHPSNGLPCNYVYVKAFVEGYLSTLANSTLIILFSKIIFFQIKKYFEGK
jgi:hypothetical protein